jgi:hypothetical protein
MNLISSGEFHSPRPFHAEKQSGKHPSFNTSTVPLGSMRKVLVAASAIAIILVLALLLSQSSAETIPYSIKGTSGEIEFRQYPSLVLATTDNSPDDAGFNLLFAYISGSNKARDKIPMTAPVITSQKIPMTSPVVSNVTSMSFVMPAGKTPEETPDPLDSRVRIVTLPEREVAVIRFTGYASPQEVDAVTVRLQDGLKKAGIETVGESFLMRYDTPWMPGFLRRNEVGIEIQRP